MQSGSSEIALPWDFVHFTTIDFNLFLKQLYYFTQESILQQEGHSASAIVGTQLNVIKPDNNVLRMWTGNEWN
jgi:hypothetical protein